MNRIFKVIWSKAKNCYVVASELAKSRTKAPKSNVISHILVASVLTVIFSFGIVLPVWATIPEGTNTGGSSSVAIGSGSVVENGASVVIGQDAQSLGGSGQNIIIGRKAYTNNAANVVAIGDGAYATGGSSIRIGGIADNDYGNYGVASGNSSMSIGFNTRATGLQSIAIGTSAYASVQDAVAIGTAANASTLYSVAIGREAKTALGSQNVAIGYKTSALGGMVIGGNSSTGNSSTNAMANNSICVGYYNILQDSYSINLGSSNTVTGTSNNSNNIVLGMGRTLTNGSNDVLIGQGSIGDGINNSVVIGTAKIEAGDGVPATIPDNWTVLQEGRFYYDENGLLRCAGTSAGGFAIGYNAQIGGNSPNSSAIGPTSKVGHDSSAALAIRGTVGNHTAVGVSIGDAGTLVDDGSMYSVALGSTARVAADRSVALGAASVATEDDVISVGHKLGDTNYKGDAYDADLNRRITNVADGVNDSDVATWGQTKDEVRVADNGNYVNQDSSTFHIAKQQRSPKQYTPCAVPITQSYSPTPYFLNPLRIHPSSPVLEKNLSELR